MGRTPRTEEIGLQNNYDCQIFENSKQVFIELNGIPRHSLELTEIPLYLEIQIFEAWVWSPPWAVHMSECARARHAQKDRSKTCPFHMHTRVKPQMSDTSLHPSFAHYTSDSHKCLIVKLNDVFLCLAKTTGLHLNASFFLNLCQNVLVIFNLPFFR